MVAVSEINLKCIQDSPAAKIKRERELIMQQLGLLDSFCRVLIITSSNRLSVTYSMLYHKGGKFELSILAFVFSLGWQWQVHAFSLSGKTKDRNGNLDSQSDYNLTWNRPLFCPYYLGILRKITQFLKISIFLYSKVVANNKNSMDYYQTYSWRCTR